MTALRTEKVKTALPTLLHPPMLEAIFELHWELQGDKQTGRMRDPSYPMMYGRIYERFKKEFPILEDLPSSQVHPEASPHMVRHRMRKEKEGHPLVQIGPGVITANEAKGYSWSSFKRLILRLVEAVSELYPSHSAPLKFVRCEMRYLNGVRLDDPKENPLHFLAEKLHIQLNMDKELFSLNPIDESPVAVNLNVAYPLHKPKGTLALNAHLGQVEGKPSYVLQTLIQSSGESLPSEVRGFDTWITEAHEAAVHSFLVLCKGKMMEKFKG
ncbi:MAG: TIGR04255 family protein [Chlamydiia bacterium]|nr:TIGR04255 family protein [Chlamydiia bacterium]